MTDTFDVGSNPSDFIRRNRQRAMGEAMTSLEDDPQKVGRAYELGRATGDSPALVYADLDNYETQHKASLTSQLLNSNSHLREYIDADSMHAKLSNDDYANLDSISGKIASFRKNLQAGPFGMVTRPGGVMDSAMQGFLDTLRESQVEGAGLKDSEIRDYPFGTAVLQTAKAPFDIIGGVFKGITEGIKSGTENITGDPKLAQDLAAMAEMQFMGQGIHGIPKPTAEGVAKGNMDLWERNPEYRKAAEQAYQAAEDTKLWLDSAKEPPAGLNKDIDKIKLDQNNADVKQLDDMVRDAQQSATRERDPDTYARFLRMRDEGTIAIDPEAVGKLYGDKVPHGEDGLLGWEPSLETQLATARATGADIEIPIANFLAKVDPEVYKALKDDIRVRPGGITKNEAKVASEQRAEVEGQREVLHEDLPQLRAHAGLEPLFSIGDRKIKLEKFGYEPAKDVYSKITAFHDFKMLDENGKVVGTLNISEQQGGKQLYVDMIQGGPPGSALYKPNFFGPALIRDLARQIKAEFPNAFGPDGLGITGHRVSGAREKAGSYMESSASPVVKLDNPTDWGHVETQAFRDILEGGAWKPLSEGLAAYMRPTEAMTQRQKDVATAINNELARLTPKQVDVATPQRIAKQIGKTVDGRELRGVHMQYTDRNPFIIVALDSSDPIGVARHEAIHHLRQQGFFTEGEWDTLARAARDNGWLEKFGIDKRYPSLDTPAKLEEAIADGFRSWKDGQPIPERIRPIFERLKELFETIRSRLKEIFGKEVSWEELFQRVDRGEVGQREGNAPRNEAAFRESVGEEPEPEAKSLFRTPATIGMTAKQANLYARAIRDMHESDIEWAKGRVEADQRKRLTAEWKQDYKNTRSEVDADMNARPDVAADLFFGRGELYGEKLPQKVKISWDDLTPEERAGLPKDYVTKAGVEGAPLDDIASLVGFPSGKAMIEHLVAYNQAKLSANMSAKAFRDRMVDLETDRQMAGKHGDLEQNVLEAAKEQVTSETQLNLLAEDMLALGIKAGLEAAINKPQLREAIQDQFEQMPISTVSSDKFLKSSGKQAMLAEIANLQGKHDIAYQAKQTQFNAMMNAREAVKLEKEQKQFASLAKRLGKRDVKGLDQEYQDEIQALLWQAGLTSRRSMIEIQRSQAMTGETLQSLVQTSKSDGWSPDVTADILAGRTKPLNQMTVQEFREFKNAITSLNKIGRAVEKINIQGEVRDFKEFKESIITNIMSRPKIDRKTQENKLWRLYWGIESTLVRSETLMKALDLGEEMGPLVNAIARPWAHSKAEKYTMQEQLAEKIKGVNDSLPKEWKKTLKDDIPNDWFRDPSDDSLFKMTREDMIGIMLNRGNKGNIQKLNHSWGSPDPARQATKAEAAAFDAKLKTWLDTHATRDDWKFVQGVWDIYKGYREGMETVWSNTAGTQPRLIEPIPVDTPHGEFDGGYFPLLRDQYLSPRQIDTGKGLFEGDYPNYSTPQGHLIERTGAPYFVDFRQPLSMIPTRMQQVIHDIAYRSEVMSAAKILRDKDIQKAIRNHYGDMYVKQLESVLEKTARGATINEKDQSAVDRVLRWIRLNLIQYALPFNYTVTGTPDIGNFNLAAMGRYWGDKKANNEIAAQWSKEIPHAIYNMDRDFAEAMQKAVGEGKMDEFKTRTTRWGYKIVQTVSQEFRTSVFIDKFSEGTSKGLPEAEAAAIADAEVRLQFGSTAIHDLPSIMTTGEKGRMMTMFYGFFNGQYNRLRPMRDMMKREEYMDMAATAFGTVVVGSVFGALIANSAREDESWLKRIAKAPLLYGTSLFPFVRETGTMVFEGIPPRTALGSVIQSTVAIGHDARNYLQGKPVEKGIQHTFAAAGLLAGFPGGLQFGRTGQGIYDYSVGKQKPRTFMEWTRLLLTGEMRLKHSGAR